MPSTVQVIATCVAAVGTVSAVVLALFLNVIRERLRRPRLRVLTPSEEYGDLVWFRGTVDDGSGRWYHETSLSLRVYADPGRDTARSTRVLLWAVDRPGDDPDRRVPDYLLKWSGPSNEETVDIPPGMFRRLDVLRGRREDGTAPFLTPALLRDQNTMRPTRPSDRNCLDEKGMYVLKFVVSCDNAGPTYWELRLDYDPPDPDASAQDLAQSLKKHTLEQTDPPAVLMR